MNFVLVFLRKTPEKWAQNSHELFVLALSLVWFARATPDFNGQVFIQSWR